MRKPSSAPGRESHGPAARRLGALAIVVCVLAACSPAPPAPPPVVPLPAPAPPPAAPPPAMPAAAPSPAPAPARVVLPSTTLPPGPIYVCDAGGTRTPIEFTSNVEALCRKHPEMGPCQFEREACRRRGGRVYTSNGEEVTVAVEAEYNRRVMRVRLQADGAPKK